MSFFSLSQAELQPHASPPLFLVPTSLMPTASCIVPSAVTDDTRGWSQHIAVYLCQPTLTAPLPRVGPPWHGKPPPRWESPPLSPTVSPNVLLSSLRSHSSKHCCPTRQKNCTSRGEAGELARPVPAQMAKGKHTDVFQNWIVCPNLFSSVISRIFLK